MYINIGPTAEKSPPRHLSPFRRPCLSQTHTKPVLGIEARLIDQVAGWLAGCGLGRMDILPMGKIRKRWESARWG